MRFSYSALLLISATAANAQPAIETGRSTFENRCSGCHGADGNGGELGPAIARRVSSRDDQQLITLIREGLPTRGMPPTKLTDDQTRELVTFLRTLRQSRSAGLRPIPAKLTLTTGGVLDGVILNQTWQDVQFRTNDKKLHLLRKVGDKVREVTSDVDWPTYNGDPGGNRYTKLDGINKSNLGRLAPKWTFTLPNTSLLQGTPIVSEGVMFVTSANECYALDAGSGRQIWHYQRPRTKDLVGNAAGGTNRGVAIAGDKVFMVTDHAHVIALSRSSGELLWDTEMADFRQNYNATSAPLIAGDYVISGSSGGEEGARGFIAAFDQKTGKEAWRFWTVPARGEPGSETWIGTGIDHGGAAAWFTGTFDPQLDTLYWPTGNPGKDYNGDQRIGDNLYSNSVVALDAKTGKLKWHYQFTPHDLWDWDATETPVLVDTKWQGSDRKLMIQANRNGFFYVFDRTDGKLLLAKPFVRKLTWASGIGADGRPVKMPNMEPSPKGTKVCPSQSGATNWYSPSFSPETGLYYIQTLERCSIYHKRDAEWEAGRAFLGGAQRSVPNEQGVKILRAIDIQTGKVTWELPQLGAGSSWGGTLTTRNGIVFFGEDTGAFMAADTVTGKPLWSFQTSVLWKASPMTYSFDKKQHIAIAAGSNIISFGITE